MRRDNIACPTCQNVVSRLRINNGTSDTTGSGQHPKSSGCGDTIEQGELRAETLRPLVCRASLTSVCAIRRTTQSVSYATLHRKRLRSCNGAWFVAACNRE